MIPELGNFCLILAACLAMIQISIFGSKLNNVASMRPIAIGQTFFVSLAFVILLSCFISNDFTLPYVAQNSNSTLPLYYKLTAIWGAHEGSLLLWILILNLWALVLLLCSTKLSRQFLHILLAVFAVVNLGFLFILLTLSNPFVRNFTNMPIDGMDLNPLLQDFGMIMHPPILYAGYVGCTVAFAFAVAALWQGKLDRTWAQQLQPWVLASWLFLTLGIALGSWWAYYELGWGGWWFWDPVENASLMPWLTATALLHCLAIAKKTGKLLLLALCLAIATFALSLLGTFLVRSGAIISVHAFTSDPKHGLCILQFLAILIGGTMLLFAVRKSRLQITAMRDTYNRTEAVILANNLLLLVATGTVLLGTFFPLIYDALFHKKLAVGYPYFNLVFVPVFIIILAFMLYGLIERKALIIIATLAPLLTAAFLYMWFGYIKLGALIGISLALAVIISCRRIKNMAMLLGHVGLAITIIGISITPAYEIEKELSVKFNEQVSLANYYITFNSVQNITGPNYVGMRADFSVYKGARYISSMHPEKRTYIARATTMTETAILPGLLQDIYIALGQQIDANTWSVRIYYKPFIRWIWLGALIMACGAGVAIYRKANISSDLVAPTAGSR